jgi:hypothetical protein
MGGKNHQPCAIYLKSSIKLSRAASAARARLESANIALEDILLSELDQCHGDITAMLKELQASRGFLENALDTLGELHAEMEHNQYHDLPSLHQISLMATGTDFTNEGIVDKAAWDKVAAIMKSRGFWGILALFKSRLGNLASSTDFLVEKISKLENVVAAGQLSLTVEQNRSGNFKTEFARLYNAWSIFDSEFLASSMLSTELWYRFNSFGSLRGHGATTNVA